MKTIFLLVAILLTGRQLTYSQGLAINTTGASADASAIMDASSALKGVLIPRMNTATVLSVSNPARGLLVYDTAKNQLMVNMGTPAVPNWQNIVYKSGWSLKGNSGTDTAINFIGTTDLEPLVFRIHNIKAGMIDTASYNTGLGFRVFDSLTSGTYNTALGYKAFISDTSGGFNTALGSNALRFNTSGFGNTATGAIALQQNTIGIYNTANGGDALASNTTGNDNTSTGFFAMYGNTTGERNVATGWDALASNTIGTANVAIGASALSANNYGNDNTGIGSSALGLNGLGATQAYDATQNTGVGSQVLVGNTIGYNNTAQGFKSIFNNSIGYNNAALGFLSLQTNYTGIGNTAVGTAADVNAFNLQNATALGYFASATASNQVRIGNGTVTSIGGYANWTNISDGRIKTKIKEDVPGLSFISKLTPVTYHLDLEAADKIIKDPSGDLTNGTSIINPSGSDQINSRKEKEQIVYTGFIAQDVEKAAKSINYQFSGVDAPKNDRDLYGLRYADFVAPMVKAIQEQQQQIETFKKEIADLKTVLAQVISALSVKNK